MLRSRVRQRVDQPHISPPNRPKQASGDFIEGLQIVDCMSRCPHGRRETAPRAARRSGSSSGKGRVSIHKFSNRLHPSVVLHMADGFPRRVDHHRSIRQPPILPDFSGRYANKEQPQGSEETFRRLKNCILGGPNLIGGNIGDIGGLIGEEVAPPT